MKGNIIDLAIGVVIGSAFTNIVNTLVSSTIMPVVSLFTKDIDLSTLFVTLRGGHFDTIEQAKEAGAIVLSYGELLNAIFNFIIISIVLFIVITIVNKSNKKLHISEETEKEATTKTCKFCKSTIAIDATVCPHCTRDIAEELKEENKESKEKKTQKKKTTTKAKTTAKK